MSATDRRYPQLAITSTSQRPVSTCGRWAKESGSDGSRVQDGPEPRPAGPVPVESKTETGRLRPDQEVWLAALHAAGQTCKVFRPSDLLAGKVQALMEEIR